MCAKMNKQQFYVLLIAGLAIIIVLIWLMILYIRLLRLRREKREVESVLQRRNQMLDSLAEKQLKYEKILEDKEGPNRDLIKKLKESEIYETYRYKFYLNASHAIYIHGKLGERHPHTWELSILVSKLEHSFIHFHFVEEKLEQYMSRYEETYLNEIEPFNTLNPTLENCAEYFKSEIMKILNEEGFMLLSMEMSETPTRSYILDFLKEEK